MSDNERGVWTRDEWECMCDNSDIGELDELEVDTEDEVEEE